MLDRNIKDHEASIELLEDRQKTTKSLMIIFYIFGSSMIAFSPIMIILDTIYTSLWLLFIGVTLLIVGCYLWTAYLQYHLILFMIHKKLIKAKEKRE